MSVDYEAVIGLEVHAQLLTESKLFCGCSTAFGAPPNTNVCPVCLGLPGALPVPNRNAVHLAMRAALSLNCEVHRHSRFARKNYFYPDLAKGYQISQFELPLNGRGRLRIESADGERDVGITRIHLEEDAAKNIHGAARGGDTLVDFNRAGVALIEIVGEPDLRSAAEAESYLKRLHEVLRFAGVNDGNLEEGSFRCDANVSIRPRGQRALGTRTELKNINSFRFVRKAIEYELRRQEGVVRAGGEVVQETRTWREDAGKTVSMRGKEEAHDYRYFPDPDLPPLCIDDAELARAKRSVPELPAARRARWCAELGLTEYDAGVLTGHPRTAEYFEQATEALCQATDLGAAAAGKRVANFVQAEVLRYVETDGLAARFPVSAQQLAGLLAEVHRGRITGKMAKDVFEAMRATGDDAARVIEDKGLRTVSDEASVEALAQAALAAGVKQVAQYRAGNRKILGYFVGQVMKASKGSADPKVVNQVLKRLLEQS